MPLIITDNRILKCPLTNKLLVNPVVFSDGVTYSESALKEHLKQNPNLSPNGNLINDARYIKNQFAEEILKQFKRENRVCSILEFCQAIRTGDIAQVDSLNYLEEHLDYRNEHLNESALLYVMRNGFYSLAKHLLRNGASAAEVTNDNLNMLHLCASNGADTELVGLFLQKLPRSQKHSYISAQCEITVPEERYAGPTKLKMLPIHIVAAAGADNSSEVMTLLVNNENVNLCEPITGFTALHFAAFHKNYGAAKALLDNGATVDPIAIFQYEFIGENNFHMTEKLKVTPLLIALKNNDFRMAELLVENHADVNFSPSAGWPLAFFCCRDTDNVELLRLLEPQRYLNSLLPVSYNDKGRDTVQLRGDEWSMLHLAVYTNRTRICQHLIDIGANVNLQTIASQLYQLTPMHVAAMCGHPAAAEILVRHRGNVNATERDSYTPLHLAIKFGHETMVRFLVCRGANLQHQSSGFFKRSQTPHAYALYYGQNEIAQNLYSYLPARLEVLEQRLSNNNVSAPS